MGNELTRNSSGNISPMSSQLAEPLWTDPGVKCGICVRELISTPQKNKKQKNAGREHMVEHSPQILASKEKATTTTLVTYENSSAPLIQASCNQQVQFNST